MPVRRPRTAQAQPEPVPAPSGMPPSFFATSLYRVTPADGSAQLFVPDYDGGHFVAAGTVLRLNNLLAVAMAIGGENLTELPWASQDQQAEQAGRGKMGVSN